MPILLRFVTTSLRFVTNRNDECSLRALVTSRNKIGIFFKFLNFFFKNIFSISTLFFHFNLFLIIFNLVIFNFLSFYFFFKFFKIFSFNSYYIFIFMTFVLHLYFQRHNSGNGTQYNLLQFVSF